LQREQHLEIPLVQGSQIGLGQAPQRLADLPWTARNYRTGCPCCSSRSNAGLGTSTRRPTLIEGISPRSAAP